MLRLHLGDTFQKRPEWQPIAHLLGCFILFMLLDWSVKYLTQIPEKAYFYPNLSLEFFRFRPLALAFWGLLFVIVLIYRTSLLSQWQVLERGNWLRLFMVFLSLLIVWPLVTQGFNFYYSQGYVVDRLMLVALWLLLIWRPIFIFPLLCLLYTLLWQYKLPDLGGSILAHKLQVMNVLTLFGGCFLYFALSGVKRSESFIVLTCCLVAGAYWLPALTKFNLGWMAHGDIAFIPIAAYAHGWLSFLTPSQIVNIANGLSGFDWPLKITVLIVEASFLVFLWKRQLALGLLIGSMLFHIGVFLLMGFFFWTWIALNAGLFTLLWLDGRQPHWQIFSKPYFIVSVTLIGLSAFWSKPPALGWFDTRLTYTFNVHAKTEQGGIFQLSPLFFTPYEDVFTMTSFSYLIKQHNVLVGPYSVSYSTDVARLLDSTQNADEVFELEKSHGTLRYNAQRANRFYEFLRIFLSEFNHHKSPIVDVYSLAPPRQFWSFKGITRQQMAGQKIVEVAIVAQTRLFDGNVLRLIRQQTLKTLFIPEKDAITESDKTE